MEPRELEPFTPAERAAYFMGYCSALHDYAWWKDGTQFVGCGRETHSQAVTNATQVYEEFHGLGATENHDS